MPCDQSKMPGGGTQWMCGRRSAPRCSVCRRRKATLLCDHHSDGVPCDKPLCERCAVRVGEVTARPNLADPIVRMAIAVTARPPKGRTAQHKRVHEALRDLAVDAVQPDTVDWCPSHPRTQTGKSAGLEED